MNYDVDNPSWEKRDRFILSKGHAGLALYTVMCKAGYIREEELKTFLKPGTHIGGEPCMRDVAGVEATTGSLGHGLSMAVGMAIAQKLDDNGSRTFVVLGDGECEEGTIWEAAMSAAAFKLDNLIAILDNNRIQKMGTIEEAMGFTNWKEKWETFGWYVQETDGHNVEELYKVLGGANTSGKPKLIIANTVKGKGVSIMENNPIWHFKSPNKKELKVFIKELDISEDEMEMR